MNLYPNALERLVWRIRLWWNRLTDPFPLPEITERYVHSPKLEDL